MELQAARAKVAALQRKIQLKEVELQESEQFNIAQALAAKEKIDPLLARIEELAIEEAEVKKKEAAAQEELSKAEEDEAAIKASGREEEADVRAQIADAHARLKAVEAKNLALAKAFEDEVLSLLSRIAIFEKRKAELGRNIEEMEAPKNQTAPSPAPAMAAPLLSTSTSTSTSAPAASSSGIYPESAAVTGYAETATFMATL